MELKLPIIFLLIISITILPNQVKAFTVCELLNDPNITAQQIQQAVDSGSVQYSDLPGSFQVNIHAKGSTVSQPTKSLMDNSMPCNTTKKQNDSLLGVVIFVGSIVIPLVIIIFIRSRINYNHNRPTRKQIDDQIYADSVSSRGTMPKEFRTSELQKKYKPVHPPHARLLLALKIIRVKKNA